MKKIIRFLLVIFLILGIFGVLWSGWWWYKNSSLFIGLQEKICEPVPKIDVYFSPKGNTDSAIINLINKTQKRLWIATYSFTNKDIYEVIKMAEERGVDVRVIQDKSQSTGKGALIYPQAKVMKGMGGGIQHNKFIISDNTCLETGSYNYSEAGELKNNENALIICDAWLIKQYADNFEKMWWSK